MDYDQKKFRGKLIFLHYLYHKNYFEKIITEKQLFYNKLFRPTKNVIYTIFKRKRFRNKIINLKSFRGCLVHGNRE